VCIYILQGWKTVVKQDLVTEIAVVLGLGEEEVSWRGMRSEWWIGKTEGRGGGEIERERARGRSC